MRVSIGRELYPSFGCMLPHFCGICIIGQVEQCFAPRSIWRRCFNLFDACERTFSATSNRRGDIAYRVVQKRTLKSPRSARDVSTHRSGHQRNNERLWHAFFSDPSQWMDYRFEKGSAKYPDFKNKKTGEGLWVDAPLNPKWVKSNLAAMVPGTVSPSSFSWNTEIARRVRNGHHKKALELFRQMQHEQISPNNFTFPPVLKACASLAALEEGRRVHEQIIQSGFELDIFVANSLVDMYAKCGKMEEACEVFRNMQTRDVVSWNAIIVGHANCGQGKHSLELFQQMQKENVKPSDITFVGALKACASLLSLEEGRRVHAQTIQNECQLDLFVANSLVTMYVKCGSMEEADRVFSIMHTRDAISWNSMIIGHSGYGQGKVALELFNQMQCERVEANSVTFVAVLSACVSLAAIEEGRQVHAHIIEQGWESDLHVGSSLVNMYSKCGSIEEACRVFRNMPTRNVVSWTAMIVGHANCGQGKLALELFSQMQREQVKPDMVTLVGAINACASLAALEHGRQVHAQIIEAGWESDLFLGSSLISMYAKCGSLEDASRVFRNMPTRDVVSWNSMIGGYALHGRGKEALQTFRQMLAEFVEINSATFVCLLTACSHAGLVDEGGWYFESMTRAFGIPATIEHYVCMVDLLGRAGHLDEAENMIKQMPFPPNVTVWRCLLGACRMHGNLDLAERIAEQILELEPQSSPAMFCLPQHLCCSCQVR